MDVIGLVLSLFLVVPCLCSISFEKDSELETVFPPNLPEQVSEYIPRGHLRPLGFQRLPERRITEYKGFPSSHAFHHGYVKEGQPIHFKDAVPTEKMKEWTDENLKEWYGNLKVRVTIKKSWSALEAKLIKIRKFLLEYKYADWYLSTIMPQEMRKDMPLPTILQCGTTSRYLQESQLWMSSGGTYSTVHYHGDHQMHCLLAGRKDFVFINKKFATDFKIKKSDDFTASGHSDMDTEMVNMFEYEKTGEIPWEWAKLSPGDCVFVPAGFLHHVRSYGRSISSVTLFSPTPDADFSDCSKEKSKPKPERTLDDANFVWTLVEGKRQLSNVRLNSESLRHHLTALLRKENKLPYVYFDTFYRTALKGKKKVPGPEGMWDLLDTKKAGYLTRDEVKNLPKDALDKVANILNRAHEKKEKKSKAPAHHEL